MFSYLQSLGLIEFPYLAVSIEHSEAALLGLADNSSSGRVHIAECNDAISTNPSVHTHAGLPILPTLGLWPEHCAQSLYPVTGNEEFSLRPESRVLRPGPQISAAYGILLWPSSVIGLCLPTERHPPPRTLRLAGSSNAGSQIAAVFVDLLRAAPSFLLWSNGRSLARSVPFSSARERPRKRERAWQKGWVCGTI
jgi:hypothetical protein